MPLLKKDPEKDAARAARDAARAAARQEAERQQREAEFWASPVGQARAARYHGQRLFELMLPVSETQRTMLGTLSGDPGLTRTATGSQRELLEAIEDEGWRLEHAGYVFQQTGSISRDKLMSTGQTAAVTGMIVGIYLFRATEGPPPAYAETTRPDATPPS
jgi:hypothetical protein